MGTRQHQEGAQRKPEDQVPDEELPADTRAHGNNTQDHGKPVLIEASSPREAESLNHEREALLAVAQILATPPLLWR